MCLNANQKLSKTNYRSRTTPWVYWKATTSGCLHHSPIFFHEHAEDEVLDLMKSRTADQYTMESRYALENVVPASLILSISFYPNLHTPKSLIALSQLGGSSASLLSSGRHMPCGSECCCMLDKLIYNPRSSGKGCKGQAIQGFPNEFWK